MFFAVAAGAVALVVLREWYVRYSLSGPVVLRKLKLKKKKKEEEAPMVLDYKDLPKGLKFDLERAKAYETRVAGLKGLLKFFDEEKEAIVEALKEDLGRPAPESLVYDVFAPRAEILHLLTNLPRLAAWKRAGFDWSLTTFPYDGAYVAPEPYGTVCVLGTWNFPFMLGLVPVAGAIAAGNAVVFKPTCSGKSSKSAQLMADRLGHYVSSASLRVVGGTAADASTSTTGMKGLLFSPAEDLAASKAVLDYGGFDMYFFTGSTRVGAIVAEKAAGKPCVLECGGKSPTYVDSSADLDLAAKRILWGRMLNAGQQCVAPDYVLCCEDKVDALCAALKKRLLAAFGDDPRHSPDFGRIVDTAECQRLKKLIDGVESSQIIAGGQVQLEEKYVAPTVVLLKKQKDKSSSLTKEEIFGPILPVVPVPSLEEAVEYVNGRPKPLATYVFAKDASVAREFVTRTSAGGVCVNDTILHAAHPSLPFGGVGASGYGAYHGDATFTAFSHSKAVLVKSTGLLSHINFFVYPPFSTLKTTLLTALLAPSHLLRRRT